MVRLKLDKDDGMLYQWHEDDVKHLRIAVNYCGWDADDYDLAVVWKLFSIGWDDPTNYTSEQIGRIIRGYMVVDEEDNSR